MLIINKLQWCKIFTFSSGFSDCNSANKFFLFLFYDELFIFPSKLFEVCEIMFIFASDLGEKSRVADALAYYFALD